MKFILQCSICLQSLNNPVSLSCGHTFCQDCINNSLGKQEICACPLCRQPAMTYSTKTDELLPIVQQIYEKEGTQGLLNEFPSLIICLCCGLTPINPVVLPCQHMFCSKCIEETLQEELLCPACQEYSITLKVNTNQKYKDLINWYFREFKMEEEQEIQQTNQVDTVNGIPLFHFDQTVIIHSQTEFNFLEFRYQEMIKIVGSGSGNFVISSDLKNGDLLQIKSIKKTNKGYQVQVESIARIKLQQIYSYINGAKTNYQKWNTQSLWFCQCQILNDEKIKEQTMQQYSYLLATLENVYQNTNKEVKDLFQNYIKKLKNYQNNDSSLMLFGSLNNNIEEEYYSTNAEKRIQLIEQHFITLEQKIKNIFAKEQQKEKAKLIQDNVEITQYPEFDVTTQYFLNLFNLNKVLSF